MAGAAAGAAEEYFTMLDVHAHEEGSLRLAAVSRRDKRKCLFQLAGCLTCPIGWIRQPGSATTRRPSRSRITDRPPPRSRTMDRQPPTNRPADRRPILPSLPEKPTASSEADQQKVCPSLAADRAHAKYSSEVLRGGTEAAAAPPPRHRVPRGCSGSETLPVAAESKPAGQGGWAPEAEHRAC